MSVLVDTNILLRSAQPSHELSAQAAHAVSNLLRQNETVYFCSQTIAEFWNVATRPSHINGLGLTQEEAWKEIEAIEDLLTLLPDNAGIYPEWKRLVKNHKVQGIKVFDARLAAIAIIYGVSTILTFNTQDFIRYSGQITLLHPTSLMS